jgi:hypothetical protein
VSQQCGTQQWMQIHKYPHEGLKLEWDAVLAWPACNSLQKNCRIERPRVLASTNHRMNRPAELSGPNRPADANRVNLALLYLAEGRDSSAQRADADAKHKYFAVRSRAACEGLVELLEACSDSRVVGFRGNDAALFLCDPAVGFRSSPVCHPYSTAKLCY